MGTVGKLLFSGRCRAEFGIEARLEEEKSAGGMDEERSLVWDQWGPVVCGRGREVGARSKRPTHSVFRTEISISDCKYLLMV